jgi:hypothetical protein
MFGRYIRHEGHGVKGVTPQISHTHQPPNDKFDESHKPENASSKPVRTAPEMPKVGMSQASRRNATKDLESVVANAQRKENVSNITVCLFPTSSNTSDDMVRDLS